MKKSSDSTKSSSAYLFKCYMWLINTIARRGPISRADIDAQWNAWPANDYRKYNGIPESTFHRWRDYIKTLYGIVIKCNSHNEYYIEDAPDILHSDLRERMIGLFSANELLNEKKNLEGKILYEHVPSGELYLAPIIEALRDQYAIQITHQGFGKPYPSTFVVEPYCLKMFKQRWYLLARSPYKDELRVYGLDRIQAVEPTNQKYEIPDSCAAERYFRHAYGVTVLEGEPEKIIISIDYDQADFLRTLPLHPSQQEIEPINGYPAFSFYVYPSDEFCQELFKYGSALEVHEPESLRKYFAEDAEKVNEMYNLEK